MPPKNKSSSKKEKTESEVATVSYNPTGSSARDRQWGYVYGQGDHPGPQVASDAGVVGTPDSSVRQEGTEVTPQEQARPERERHDLRIETPTHRPPRRNPPTSHLHGPRPIDTAQTRSRSNSPEKKGRSSTQAGPSGTRGATKISGDPIQESDPDVFYRKSPTKSPGTEYTLATGFTRQSGRKEQPREEMKRPERAGQLDGTRERGISSSKGKTHRDKNTRRSNPASPTSPRTTQRTYTDDAPENSLQLPIKATSTEIQRHAQGAHIRVPDAQAYNTDPSIPSHSQQPRGHDTQESYRRGPGYATHEEIEQFRQGDSVRAALDEEDGSDPNIQSPTRHNRRTKTQESHTRSNVARREETSETQTPRTQREREPAESSRHQQYQSRTPLEYPKARPKGKRDAKQKPKPHAESSSQAVTRTGRSAPTLGQATELLNVEDRQVGHSHQTKAEKSKCSICTTM
ncbi:hypothetical protein BDV96DRAFT_100172 [Lophiotrema nucula]|uniref:Uncharacterized protein n=1 Tax=Lophiotrema nucula TaxID=690887 RepID=A0A6A5Z501_9PLEO|nr:hypothetical protein BDV96DRAFT_100172 [Lophiotrema nucula]